MAARDVTIGVDLGGTKLAAALVGADGRASPPRRWPVRVRAYDDVLAAIGTLCAELREQAERDGGRIVAVGVAAAAFLDADRRTVRQATYLGWRDRPLAADLAARLELPVALANDADAAAWGEHVHGAAQDERCLALATVGTGIGGGAVVDGRLLTGAHGLGAQFGHLPVEPGGRPCVCGARGCLEEYASGTALTRAVRAAAAADPAGGAAVLARAGGDPERIDGPLVTAAARAGDPLTQRALAEAGEWLGRGLAQIAAVLDPGLVLVGGGLADAGDLLLGPARAAFAATLTMPAVHTVAPILPAALGNAAGLVGAAALARVAAGESTRA